MRDSLLKFGNISLATKDVQAYSADVLDLGAVDKWTKHHPQDGLVVCFRNTTALASVDSYIPILQDSADNSTYNDLLSGQQTATSLAAGTILRIPIPKEYRRYLRASAMPKSTGTFTAVTVEAWIEGGGDVQTP